MTLTLGAAERAKVRVVERLAKTREPLIRLNMLAALVCQTYEQLLPHDQWPQFIAPLLRDLRDISSPTRFEHFASAELNRLSDALRSIPGSAEASEILKKIEWAQFSRALYVADTDYFANELDIRIVKSETHESTLSYAEAVILQIRDLELHERANRIVTAWKYCRVRSHADWVAVLLVVPGETDWPAAGVLTSLSLNDVPHSQVARLRFAEVQDDVTAGVIALDAALQAATSWLARGPNSIALAQATLRLNDVHGAIDGPSLGLAIAGTCISYTMSHLPMRTQYRIAANIALTGAIDSDGRIHSVEGICEKVTRTFFSPIDYIAVPTKLEIEAENVIAELNRRFPLRSLEVIPLRNLDDLFSQRRLVSEYTVALPLHVLHQAARLPRWTLVALTIVVLCFVFLSSIWHYYPRTKPWLDRIPAQWDATNGSELIVYNKDHIELWRWQPEMDGKRISWLPVQFDSSYKYPDNSDNVIMSSKEGWGESSRAVCKIADSDADGKPEVYFVSFNRLDAHGCDSEPPVELCCLSSSGELRWRRLFDSLDISPLAALGMQPVTIRCWQTIDWQGEGHANVVLALNDRSHNGRPFALIEEIDGRTGRTRGQFWHWQWFWILTSIPRTGIHKNSLWAGTLNQQAFPELFTFRDSIRTRVCPFSDTTGIMNARFPIADVFQVLDKGAWIISINGNSETIQLQFGNKEILNPLGGPWRGYNFIVDHNLKWIPAAIPNAWWGEIQLFINAGVVPKPSSPMMWLAPLTWAEIWTGREWVPADTVSKPPKPYPFYNDSTRTLLGLSNPYR